MAGIHTKIIRRGASPLGNGSPRGRRVGLEPVGYWCHSGRKRIQRGVDRANDLSLTKWTIIYVTWEDLVLPPDEFVAKAQKALAAQRPQTTKSGSSGECGASAWISGYPAASR
ncbi:MAG: hypothetical protein QOG36_1672 [Actinomycetota bacterium]|jgi:hypothetical protein|nr:hypothetical protein [Actinomycetota bacterium]